MSDSASRPLLSFSQSVSEMNIVKTEPDDAVKLIQIAFTTKSYYDYPARWIELWHDAVTVFS